MNKSILYIILVALLISSCNNSENLLTKDNWSTIGRGDLSWETNTVVLKNNFIFSNHLPNVKNYEFSFKAKANDDETQLWSGFGFENRNNRYALGLRGKNSNDLYLCKYQDGGKSNDLAHEKLDFEIKKDKWYAIRVVFYEGDIQVYLNNEKEPRLVVKDEDFINSSKIVLGGGWSSTAYKDLTFKEISALPEIVKYSNEISLDEKEAIRVKQRNNYKPFKIENLTNQKEEYSLNGDWLFIPENDIEKIDDAIGLESEDVNWHIIDVPNMWKPMKSWMHGFNRGVSDNFEKVEKERCDKYTFDYKNSRSGYYRHWLDLPEGINSKKVFIDFSAVAKVAEVWVNGNNAGKHIGMFSNFKYEIGKYLKGGKNLISVKVNDDISQVVVNGDQIETVAISVEVTKEMLNSLPKGMHDKEAVGIWQDVKLIVSEDIYIDNVYARMKLDEANLDVTVSNTGSNDRIFIEAKIFEKDSDKVVFELNKKEVRLLGKQTKKVTVSTGKVKAKLWSPKHPNLYTMQVNIRKNGKIIDEIREDIGFRTIEAKGNKFYLNGEAYWLQGANHPPIGIAPNDVKLANTFLKAMHDNNQMVTRTHGTSITKAWADAANKQGVGVSAEGTWPWVMLGKDMPSMYLLELWHKEMIAIVKKYRNNPSILFWTLSNESYFTNSYHKESTQEMKMVKWKVLSDLTKEIREIDPSRPISPTSGYIRDQPDYENVLKPAGIDDGDFDDSHNSYFGWYNPDHYFLYDGKWTEKLYLSTGANPNRPFVSQELSSGYPNNDSGHPTRDYIFDHHVPQAWVGDWAYEDHDPSFYLNRNAFLTKEIGEVVRRTSPKGAGVMHFANICWFRNVYDADRIENYPIVDAMKKALSPVLISAELFGRNFYSDTSFNTRVCIVNDLENGNSIAKGTLKWEVLYDGETLSSGSIKTNKLDHYGRQWNNLTIELPKSTPIEKANCKLKLSLLVNNKEVSFNEYDLLVSNKSWVKAGIDKTKSIKIFDPKGATKKVLNQLDIPFSEVDDLNQLEGDLLIVANLDELKSEPSNLREIAKFSKNGGKVLLINAGNHILSIVPDKIESILDKPGRIVNMHIPESKAFDNIEPSELSWWQQSHDKYPTACKRSYRLKNSNPEEKLGTFIEVHSYLGGDRGEKLNEMSGSPLVQFEIEKGTIIASEMDLNVGDKDPISGKLLVNLINLLTE